MWVHVMFMWVHVCSVISNDGDVEKEVNTRLAKAATVFRRRSNIWKSGSLGLNIKLQLYTAVVVSTAIYASEKKHEKAQG